MRREEAFFAENNRVKYDFSRLVGCSVVYDFIRSFEFLRAKSLL
jgi:hypothetical protein